MYPKETLTERLLYQYRRLVKCHHKHIIIRNVPPTDEPAWMKRYCVDCRRYLNG